MLELIRKLFDWLAGLQKPTPNETVIEIRAKRSLAWGQRVSAEFRERVFEIADQLGMNPDHLMAVMAFETGETFRPDIRNAAGSGATGLIQFMPATARGLATTPDELARLTAARQVDFGLLSLMS